MNGENLQRKVAILAKLTYIRQMIVALYTSSK